MKYYVIKLLTNTAGQDGSSIAVFDDIDKARVHYHQTLAAFHNAEDVLFAVVEIQTAYGNTDIKEIVDHTNPAPNEEEA